MKHFVIVRHWACNDIQGFDILAVTHTIESAKEVFEKYLIDERQLAEDSDYTVYEDNETTFDAGIDGFYNDNHIILSIEEITER